MNSITDFLSSFLPVVQADAPEEKAEESQQPKEESEEKTEDPAEEEEDEPEDVCLFSKFLRLWC